MYASRTTKEEEAIYDILIKRLMLSVPIIDIPIAAEKR